MIQPEVGKLYRHYKGNVYQVLAIGLHTETLEELVVYKATSGDQVWIRPLKMWIETVKVNNILTSRFTLITS